MKKFLRIYWNIIKFNIAILFANKSNFYNSIVISIGWGIVSVTSIFIMTARISRIYSWSREDLYLLAGLYSIAVGIFHMVFSSSLEQFGRTISLGQLDTYLLTPIDAQLYLSTKIFRPASVFRIIIGIIFTGVIIKNLHIMISLFTFLSSFLFLLIGILFMYSLWFFVVTIMIWNPNLTNLISFLFIANNFGRYPTSMVSYTKNIFLYLLIPLTLITTVPADILLGRANWWEILLLVLCSGCLFILSRAFWQYGLRHYGSASS